MKTTERLLKAIQKLQLSAKIFLVMGTVAVTGLLVTHWEEVKESVVISAMDSKEDRLRLLI